MCAKSSTGRTQPQPARDVDHVVHGAELAHASHHLDAERHRAILLLEPRAQLAELLDTESSASSRERPSRKPGWKTTTSAPRGLRDAGRVVEHPDRHVQLLAALGVPHEAGDRRVHRERDVRRRGASSPNRGREVVVHPEAALEVDLARACSRAPAAPRAPPPATPATARAPGRSGSLPAAKAMPSAAPFLHLQPMSKRPAASTSSSSTSTSGSPTSGARRPTSPSGTSRSSPPSCAPPTARATATRSPRTRPARSAPSTATASPRGGASPSRTSASDAAEQPEPLEGLGEARVRVHLRRVSPRPDDRLDRRGRMELLEPSYSAPTGAPGR